MDQIKAEAVGYLFNLEVQVDEEADNEDVELEVVEPMRQPVPGSDRARETPQIHAKGLDAPKKPQNLSYSAPSEDGEVEVRGTAAVAEDDPFAGTGRNADCPCGSGKKFKKCHGAPGGPTGLTARIS